MQRIVVLSGKGGTGKTSICSSLAVVLAKTRKIIAVDCDVDAPNLGLVLGLEEKDFLWKDIQTSEKARLISEKCSGKKMCVDVCNFGAISWDEKKQKPTFNKFLCEGCGACQLVCPKNAIKLTKVTNGKIGSSVTNYGFPVISGQLKMGESGSGKIVTLIKNEAEKIAKEKNLEIELIDSSAGIGCPVIASVQGSDFAICVTEPTPSAFSDLKKSLKVVEHFKIPYGIIVNKYNLNKGFARKIHEFMDKNKIPILGEIPYNKKFIEALVNMTPIVDYDKKFEGLFIDISKRIKIKNY